MSKKNKGGNQQKGPQTGFSSNMAVDTMNSDPSTPLRAKYAGGVKAMLAGMIGITALHFINGAIDALFGVSEEDGGDEMVPKSALEKQQKYIQQLKAQIADLESGDDKDSDD